MLRHVSLTRDLREAFAVPDELAVGTFDTRVWLEPCGYLALVGRYFPNLVGTDVYIWLTLRKEQLTPALLRKGLHLIDEYFSDTEWTFYAEVDPGNKLNSRFLEHCGFTYLADLGDRALYKRDN